MILVDTSVWIDFLKKKSPHCDFLLHLLEHREVLCLELVFAELLQGAKNNRERKTLMAYWENSPKLNQDGLPKELRFEPYFS